MDMSSSPRQELLCMSVRNTSVHVLALYLVVKRGTATPTGIVYILLASITETVFSAILGN
jgi:hypothetical protein